MKVKIKYIKDGRTWNVPWDDAKGDPVKIARAALAEHGITAAIVYDDSGSEIARVTRNA